MIVDGVWTLGVTLPSEVERGRFLAGTVAECVPWLRDDASSRQGVRVPFSLAYSDEEQEQLVLVAAKVVYYLRESRENGHDSGEAQDAGAVTSSPVEAAADPS